MQPSMSRSALLLQCPYPFSPRGEPSRVDQSYFVGGEAARYGSAYHDLAARLRRLEDPIDYPAVAARYGFTDPSTQEELWRHACGTHGYLLQWLSNNEFRIDFTHRDYNLTSVEAALALTPLESARACDSHNEDHVYTDASPFEIPGTLDYAKWSGKLDIAPRTKNGRLKHVKGLPPPPIPLLLDDKTGMGEDFSRPLLIPQLLTLAAAVMRFTKTDRIILGILHTPRRGMPKIYAEKVKLIDLSDHENTLRQNLSRIGDGSMRPGVWCQRCPARSNCPAQDSDLLSKAGDVLQGLQGLSISQETAEPGYGAIVVKRGALRTVEEKLGMLYDLARVSERLTGRVRDEIRKALEADGSLLPVLPDGSYLRLNSYSRSSLSKASILEAYGKVEGARVIDRLTKDGAVKTTPVKALHVEKDR